MILKADQIAEKLQNLSDSSDPLVIMPHPDLDELRASGSGIH